jgi:hypothetical protein
VTVRTLLTLLFLALAPPVASAATREVATAPVTAGPVLVGHRVFWAEGSGSSALTVKEAEPGHRPKVVWTRSRRTDGRRQFVVRIAHSGSHVEVLWREVTPGSACQAATVTRDLALAGRRQLSLTETDTCAPVTRSYTVELRNPVSGNHATLAQGSAVLTNLTTQGEFAAWQAQGAAGKGDPITVYDVAAGRIAYTVQDPALTIGRDQIAMARDGRLAAAVFDPSASTVGPRYDLDYYDAQHPGGQAILGLFSTGGAIAFADGRIAFVRPLGGGVTELTLTTLTGSTRTLATFRVRRARLESFDYDGTHAVWAQHAPGGSTRIFSR